MMTIADSTEVVKCFLEGTDIPVHEMIVPDDLYNEYLVAEERHDKKLAHVVKATELEGYSEAYYLRQYARFLNDYSGVSFTKMSGFGDISVLALTASIVDGFGKKLPQLALELGDVQSKMVCVITDDLGLANKIKATFNDNEVLCQSLEEYSS